MDNSTKEKLSEIKNNLDKEYYMPEAFRENADGNYGMVVEKILGVEENNLSTPDLGTHELKTKKKGSSCRTTLFCNEPNWISEPDLEDEDEKGDKKKKSKLRDFVEAIKISDTNQRAYTTVSIKENNRFLKIDIDGENLYLYFCDQKIAYWPIAVLKKRANEKIDNLVVAPVSEKEKIVKIEDINIYENLLEDEFVKKIKQGKIVVEFRCKITDDNKLRNRGTCFRMHEKDIKLIYEESE